MFEGKVIDFYNHRGEYRRAKVVACVKDIGITIVKESDPNYFCCCLIMKNAPNFKPIKGEITFTRKLFTQIRKMIIAGTVDLREMNESISSTPASSSTCPFNS